MESGGNAVYSFAAAYALLVVGVARCGAVPGKALQALAFPGQRVAPVAERVADLVIGDGLPVVADEFVLPSGIVSVTYGVRRRTQRAGGIGVLLLFQEVARVPVAL